MFIPKWGHPVWLFSLSRNSAGQMQRTFSRPQEKYREQFLGHFFTGLNRTCPMVELVPLNQNDQEAKFLKSIGSKRRPSSTITVKVVWSTFFLLHRRKFLGLDTYAIFWDFFLSLSSEVHCVSASLLRHCCVRSLIWKWESEPPHSLFRFLCVLWWFG